MEDDGVGVGAADAATAVGKRHTARRSDAEPAPAEEAAAAAASTRRPPAGMRADNGKWLVGLFTAPAALVAAAPPVTTAVTQGRGHGGGVTVGHYAGGAVSGGRFRRGQLPCGGHPGRRRRRQFGGGIRDAVLSPGRSLPAHEAPSLHARSGWEVVGNCVGFRVCELLLWLRPSPLRCCVLFRLSLYMFVRVMPPFIVACAMIRFMLERLRAACDCLSPTFVWCACTGGGCSLSIMCGFFFFHTLPCLCIYSSPFSLNEAHYRSG